MTGSALFPGCFFTHQIVAIRHHAHMLQQQAARVEAESQASMGQHATYRA